MFRWTWTSYGGGWPERAATGSDVRSRPADDGHSPVRSAWQILAAADTDKADQKTRDLVALGGGAQDAGDDGARQVAEAQALYGPKFEARLQNADWQEAIAVASEAEKLGLTDLEARAKARAKSEIVKMGDDARKNFDQCLATDDRLKQMVKLLALAQLMEVGSAAEATITSVLSDTAGANTLMHLNKLPPECARWNFKLTT